VCVYFTNLCFKMTATLTYANINIYITKKKGERFHATVVKWYGIYAPLLVFAQGSENSQHFIQ
jgi:hypothetical protein